MRVLLAGLLVALTTSHTGAADNNEDKAKEAASAFLKALAAKDLDALMKTVDAPVSFDLGASGGPTIDKPEELKQALAKLVETAQPDKVRALKPGTVLNMEALAKYAKDKGDKDEFAAKAEKLVGKSGYMVMLVGAKGAERLGLLVRIKDGKAFVAGIPK
jgi:hypothetical protein